MKQSTNLSQWTSGPACPRINLRRGSFISIFAPVLLACALILSGCGASDNTSNGGAETPVPTPTMDPSGYQAIDMQACSVADWSTMQTNQLQGDLIAWQPLPSGQGSKKNLGGNIAYLAPAERTSWFTGELKLALGPTYEKHLSLAPGIHANGSLTWSASGSRLAFIAFRSNENLYTVMVVNADGSNLVDLFPNDLARTDSRTSEKAILGWESESELGVLSSCGEECRLSYTVSVDSGDSTAGGTISEPTPVADYHTLSDNLQIHSRIKEYKKEEFPKGIRSLDSLPDDDIITLRSSPDDRMIDFLDKRGFLWLLSQADKTMYPLDIGLRDINETQWSLDSASLGIRAEDRIFIYEVPCRTHN